MTEKLSFGGASEDAPPVVREVSYDQEPPNGEVEGSLIARLRKAAAASQKMKVIDMPVEGEFGKQLQIRYSPLDPEPMDRFVSRRSELREMQETNPRIGLPFTELNMDLMAQACVAVVGADENGESKTVLRDDNGGLRLEHRLAVFLGYDLPRDDLTSREVIMLLFGGNAMAIIDHGDDLLAWLRNPVEGTDPSKS